MYAGGGYRNDSDSQNTIFKYSIRDDFWDTLPYSETVQYSLATLNGELITIGGIVSWKTTNLVYTLRDGAWVKLLPPMPTSRLLCSTISHKNRYIIVAGGVISVLSDGQTKQTDAVELYDKNSKQWYSTIRLPFLTYNFTTCIIGDKCYALGGAGTAEESCTTMCISLSSLINYAKKAYSSPRVWEQLEGIHPLIYTTPAEIDGKLTAMGGSYEKVSRRGMDYISTYDFKTNTWTKCEGTQLPATLYRPGVIKLDDNRLMVIGGQPKMQQFSNEVYIGTTA